MIKNNNKKNNGFTLAELMTSVAIFSIISMILFVTFSSGQKYLATSTSKLDSERGINIATQDINFSIRNGSLSNTNILSNAKDMALTKKTCIIKQHAYDLYINDVIENYKENHDKLSYDFWVKYFKQISQQIIMNTIRNNDKLSFIRFCNEIPLKLIPWRYRIMCYILKKTNK